jgi:branched-chain amino acid transport system ATP-binding protein
MTPALEFRGIGHRFGRSNTAREVLRDVNLSITAGERHALIGPNGAGKSTLFNLACGTLTPRAGSIRLHGADIAGLAPYEISRRGLARSHQVTSVFATLSVLDNLRCAIVASRGGRHAPYAFWRRLDAMQAVRAQAETIAASIGLAACLGQAAGELPYGAQRALELGIAVAGHAADDAANRDTPGVILLDEPTAGMSLEESRATVELIRRVTVGRTLLLVEHDMDVVFGLADRISVLAGGAIITTGTPDAIRRHAGVREAYLSPAPNEGAAHA